MSHIVMLEDDVDYATEFSEYLQSYGIRISLFTRFDDLLGFVNADKSVDCMILDQFVGEADILPKIAEIRSLYSGALLVLTGNKQEMDRVIGLEVGADDFMSKTQSPREILARIRAVLRRTDEAKPAPAAPAAPRGSDWSLNRNVFDLTGPQGARLGLTGAQFRTLEILWEHAGKPVARADIHAHVFGAHNTNVNRSVDVLVSQVRRKLAATIGSRCEIRAIRGSGYLFSGIQSLF